MLSCAGVTCCTPHRQLCVGIGRCKLVWLAQALRAAAVDRCDAGLITLPGGLAANGYAELRFLLELPDSLDAAALAFEEILADVLPLRPLAHLIPAHGIVQSRVTSDVEVSCTELHVCGKRTATRTISEAEASHYICGMHYPVHRCTHSKQSLNQSVLDERSCTARQGTKRAWAHAPAGDVIAVGLHDQHGGLRWGRFAWAVRRLHVLGCYCGCGNACPHTTLAVSQAGADQVQLMPCQGAVHRFGMRISARIRSHILFCSVFDSARS